MRRFVSLVFCLLLALPAAAERRRDAEFPAYDADIGPAWWDVCIDDFEVNEWSRARRPLRSVGRRRLGKVPCEPPASA